MMHMMTYDAMYVVLLSLIHPSHINKIVDGLGDSPDDVLDEDDLSEEK